MEYFCPLCGSKCSGEANKLEVEADGEVHHIAKLYIECAKCKIKFSMRLY